ncbi:MAG TPA: hypothetical protein VGR22_08765 [Thermomicrobiales bacterium]|nr:hypothetical protein [Thermomicrobiales bacterium]
MSAVPLNDEFVRRFGDYKPRKQAAEDVEYEEIGPAVSRLNVKPEMHPAAYYGLAGDVVRAITPTTEADPVAVLVTFLAEFGNAVGRRPHMMIGESRHGANLFVVLTGETARGRKDDSTKGVKRFMQEADQTWTFDHLMGGLSSG